MISDTNKKRRALFLDRIYRMDPERLTNQIVNSLRPENSSALVPGDKSILDRNVYIIE